MLNDELKKRFFQMCIGVAVCSAVMVLVFALCGYFKLNVLFGTLLGVAATLLNYFLLALSVERVAEKGQKEGQAFMKTSYILRLILLGAVIIMAIKLSCFNYIAAILPLLFPRIVIFVFDLIEKRKKA